MNKRTDAREAAFKLIFEYLFTEEQDDSLVLELAEEYQLTTEKEYMLKLYNGVMQNKQELLKKISEISLNFAEHRIFKIDSAILILALYEILYIDSVPYAVSVNEALLLAKKYSTDKSYKFINGILSKVEKK